MAGTAAKNGGKLKKVLDTALLPHWQDKVMIDWLRYKSKASGVEYSR